MKRILTSVFQKILIDDNIVGGTLNDNVKSVIKDSEQTLNHARVFSSEMEKLKIIVDNINRTITKEPTDSDIIKFANNYDSIIIDGTIDSKTKNIFPTVESIKTQYSEIQKLYEKLSEINHLDNSKITEYNGVVLNLCTIIKYKIENINLKISYVFNDALLINNIKTSKKLTPEHIEYTQNIKYKDFAIKTSSKHIATMFTKFIDILSNSQLITHHYFDVDTTLIGGNIITTHDLLVKYMHNLAVCNELLAQFYEKINRYNILCIQKQNFEIFLLALLDEQFLFSSKTIVCNIDHIFADKCLKIIKKMLRAIKKSQRTEYVEYLHTYHYIALLNVEHFLELLIFNIGADEYVTIDTDGDMLKYGFVLLNGIYRLVAQHF